ncbi:MAG: helix-turn-helix domain-containing protein [Actinobacteria bacterium]|nr:helix-turn-helix domain-containing protein [Actinomycetota bacterium]
MYTVTEVAQILDLHPKTVRRFIREGRIRAQKIGREWRVRREDLREYAHAELAGRPGEVRSDIPVADRIHVSAVIELEDATSEEMSRLSNSILAILNGRDPAWGNARYDLIFHPETRRARFVLHGSPQFIRALLECLEVLAAPGDGW